MCVVLNVVVGLSMLSRTSCTFVVALLLVHVGPLLTKITLVGGSFSSLVVTVQGWGLGPWMLSLDELISIGKLLN